MSQVKWNGPEFGQGFIQPALNTSLGGAEKSFRDEVAVIAFTQLMKSVDTQTLIEVGADNVALTLSKSSFVIADRFMRERYESNCVKATGINLDNIANGSYETNHYNSSR